jgi:putative acetyltransferase
MHFYVEPVHRRQDCEPLVLDETIRTAHPRHYRHLYLETGTGEAFEAAHSLYTKNGFTWCAAFADYAATKFNVFMVRNL